jgi:hypothetical protein
MEENAYKILVGNLDGKGCLGELVVAKQKK